MAVRLCRFLHPKRRTHPGLRLPTCGYRAAHNPRQLRHLVPTPASALHSVVQHRLHLYLLERGRRFIFLHIPDHSRVFVSLVVLHAVYETFSCRYAICCACKVNVDASVGQMVLYFGVASPELNHSESTNIATKLFGV